MTDSELPESVDGTSCYICDHGNEDVLQNHHIVPRRFGGPDTDDNTVLVCPNCHYALERIYGPQFWNSVQRTLAYESQAIIAELQAELEKQRVSGTRTSIVDHARAKQALTNAEAAKKRLKDL